MNKDFIENSSIERDFFQDKSKAFFNQGQYKIEFNDELNTAFFNESLKNLPLHPFVSFVNLINQKHTNPVKLEEITSRLTDDFIEDYDSTQQDLLNEFNHLNTLEYLPPKLLNNIKNQVDGFLLKENQNIHDKLTNKVSELIDFIISLDDSTLEKHGWNTFERSFYGYEYGLVISNAEAFAIPKYWIHELIVRNAQYYDSEEFKSYRDILQYKTKEIDDTIVNKPLLYFFEEKLEQGIENCKAKFKEELIFVSNEHDYFDYIINELFLDYEKAYEIVHKKFDWFTPLAKEYLRSFIKLLKWIKQEYLHLIKKEDRDKLDSIIHPRDYINTFKVSNNTIFVNKKNIFVKLQKTLKSFNYIDNDVTSNMLENLFKDKRYMNRKINWTGNKTVLHTFISRLTREGGLRNTPLIISQNKWEITSRYFLIKGKTITTKEIRETKLSTGKKITENMDKIIAIFMEKHP